MVAELSAVEEREVFGLQLFIETTASDLGFRSLLGPVHRNLGFVHRNNYRWYGFVNMFPPRFVTYRWSSLGRFRDRLREVRGGLRIANLISSPSPPPRLVVQHS